VEEMGALKADKKSELVNLANAMADKLQEEKKPSE